MIYLAAPFFNGEQNTRERNVKNKLRRLGLAVWSPLENCVCPPDATIDERNKVFNDNLEAIDNSDIVFAITDGKDMGTLFEVGYAYANKKRIIYYCETLGNGQFNLMLAQSAFAVITSLDGITIDIINGGNDYVGKIE